MLICGKDGPSGEQDLHNHVKPVRFLKHKKCAWDALSTTGVNVGTRRPWSVRFCCTGTTNHCTKQRISKLDIIQVQKLEWNHEVEIEMVRYFSVHLNLAELCVQVVLVLQEWKLLRYDFERGPRLQRQCWEYDTLIGRWEYDTLSACWEYHTLNGAAAATPAPVLPLLLTLLMQRQ